MKRCRMVMCASLVCAVALATAAYAVDSQTGTWKLNVAKSKFSPAAPPKSQVSRVTATADGMAVNVDRVDSDVKTVHYEWSAKYDGKEYPVKGDPARDMVSVKKFDDYTFKVTGKKNGKPTTTTRIVYAKDGKSRTETVTGTTPEGQKVNNVTFWDRQ